MRARPVLVSAILLFGAGFALPSLMQPEAATWLLAAEEGWSEGQAPATVLALRAQNPEWDFMTRTFLVLAEADRALSEPATGAARLAIMDAAIRDTLAMEAAHGQAWYLLPYASARPWRGPGRSLFVDGELLVMMGARRLVSRRLGLPERWAPQMQARAVLVADSFGAASPLLLAESYPDEGWTFCHAMAMLGLRMHEVLDRADHQALRDSWLELLRGPLTEPQSGLLVSEFDLQGRVNDGPEGSSLFFVIAALQVLDPALARQQQDLAREALGGHFLRWAYAREWPEGGSAWVDVDSGPLVPVLGASASASGFAIASSRAVGDAAWHEALVSSLGAAELVMAVFPPLAQAADHPLGQAVVAWGLGLGPLWAELGSPE